MYFMIKAHWLNNIHKHSMGIFINDWAFAFHIQLSLFIGIRVKTLTWINELCNVNEER